MRMTGPGVCVVVIARDDAESVGAAVRSALAQGPAVTEVVAVDDASRDRTPDVLDALAAREPRLRVVRRAENSGGRGTPRNDGVAVATAEYVMFLDSDGVLPDGAVRALLTAAETHGTPVTVGVAVRRELPGGREVRWQPALYREAAVLASPEDHPELLRDTLCVNKLYRRAFLDRHRLRCPEGTFAYEDFVFTARVLAAGPPIAVVPDTVCVRRARREAGEPVAPARRDIGDWAARVAAHRHAVDVFTAARRPLLAAACRTKFLDDDLCLYVRELPGRDPAYQRAWWRLARAYLASFTDAERAAAAAPARWITAVVLAGDAPRDLARLAQLAADPARLAPPYARTSAGPVWSDGLRDVRLDGLGQLPLQALPLTVDGTLFTGRHGRLRLRIRDLYGRLAAVGGPVSVEVDVIARDGAEPAVTTTATAYDECGRWRASVPLDVGRLAAAGCRGTQTWDVRVRLRYADGTVTAPLAPRAQDSGLRRTVTPCGRYGVALIQAYRTAGGSLALRLAPGARGAFDVALRRLRSRSRTTASAV
ncbi:glycosyltransferase family 2 protein [Streptomyces sp. NPDC088910]|uniref:glycosyltransferase family 2 protein n=1 Tax=Streptomyces sp. NPDC088910 TaxID=3365911 RepID=UPI003803363A